MIRKLGLSVALLLAACGDSNDLGLDSKELAAYDRAALETLASGGEGEKAIQIIRAKEQLNIATSEDFLALAQIYVTQLNGVAAQVAVEKARSHGALDAQTALQMGSAYMLQGRLKEAKEELRNIKLSGRDGFEALMLQADIAVQEGDIPLARKFYSFAAETDRATARVDMGLALLEFGEDNLEAAKAAAAMALSKDADNAMAYYVLGAIARLDGQPDQALDLLHTAIGKQPQNIHALLELTAAYLDVGKPEEAERVLDAAMAIAPRYALTQFYVAFLHAQKGELREAQDILLRTGELVTAYPAATRLFGLVSYQLENYSAAAKYLQIFLDRNPSDRQVRLALAESYVKAGSAEKSLVVLEPLTHDDAQDAEAQAAAGAANAAMGNNRIAAENFRKAVTFAAGDEEAAEGAEVDRNIRGGLIASQAFAEYAAGNLDTAIELLSGLEDLGLLSVEYMTSIANMQLQAQLYEDALATAEKLIAREGGEAIGYNIKGAVYYRTGRAAEAVEATTKALERVPAYQSALKNRAYAYSALGNHAAAKTDLKELVSKVATDGQLFAKLGHSHLMLGEFSDARIALAQARRLLPGSAVVAANYGYALAQLEVYDEALVQTQAALALATDETMKSQLQQAVASLKDAKVQQAAERELK